MNIVKFGTPVTCRHLCYPSETLELNSSCHYSNYHTSSEAIHVDCFEIEIADIKGEVLIGFFLVFFRMRLDATTSVFPCIPLCIPNIDCPAIASIFSQSPQYSHHRFHHTSLPYTRNFSTKRSFSRPRGHIQNPYCCFLQYSLHM